MPWLASTPIQLTTYVAYDLRVDLRALRAKIDGPVGERPSGSICEHIKQPIALQLFLCIAFDWPEHSGMVSFPVPAEGEPMIAWRDKPKWEGAYGESRRRLLDFALAELDTFLPT